ncbi:MAG: LysR substrate-binding domain-containing protein, partial [Caldimonas sp.]
VTWRDLKDAPLLGPRQGNPLREQLDFALAGEGITLTNVFEISVPLTILGMVENGMGIGVLTSTGSRLAVAMGLAVRKIAGPVIKRDISLLVHAERSLSPAAQNLRDLLIERRAELAPA